MKFFVVLLPFLLGAAVGEAEPKAEAAPEAKPEAKAEAKPDAKADAKAEAKPDGPGGHHHHHHPHPPVPSYTPAPPAYGYTPAPYGHEPAYKAPYPSPAPYAAPYPSPAPYAPAPYAPAPYPEAYHGPPKCAKAIPSKQDYAFCLEDPEYPTYEIQTAIEYNYDAVQQLYKDVLANTENSVDRLKDIVEETYLCPAVVKYIQPLRATNVQGKWRIIVNGVKAHYETLSQTARVEECTSYGQPCPLIPECYESKCVQKSVYHRFLVYDPYDQYLPFAIESFKLPSACACYNGAYIYHH